MMRTPLIPVVMLLCALAGPAGGEAMLRQETMDFTLNDPGWARQFSQKVATLENDRIEVRIAPGAGGNVFRFADKTRERSPFSRLADNFSNTGRWEPQRFEVRIDDRGPDRAAVTLIGQGRLTPWPSAGEASAPAPATLTVERTMSIDADSTRLRVQVKLTNSGQTPVKQLRYMAHLLYSYRVLPGQTVYAYMPTDRGIALFDHEAIAKSMAVASMIRPDHPYARWSRPGETLHKGRFDPPAWVAMFADDGHSYISLDPGEYDYLGLWTGTHPSEWLVIEPNSRGVDLGPGESTQFSYTLAYDAADVQLGDQTLACAAVSVPERMAAGGMLEATVRVATVQDQPEAAEAILTLLPANGAMGVPPRATGRVTFDAEPFLHNDVAIQLQVPADLPEGDYPWTIQSGKGQVLGRGWLTVGESPAASEAAADNPAADNAAGETESFPPANWSNDIAMQFVRIPAGSFTMGAAEDDPKAEPDEKPAREVRISRSFLIGRFAVTNAQFRQFRPGHRGAHDAHHVRKPQVTDRDDQPVLTGHAANPAIEFCAWLNENDTAKPDGWAYRLPTEAEWEYAARGPRGYRYPWGNTWDSRRADFGHQRRAWARGPDGESGPADVGSHSPVGDSPFGVADMAGGVWEWCRDFYDPYIYENGPAVDPVHLVQTEGDNLIGEGSEVRRHVARGGSWASLPDACRTTYRYVYGSTHAPTFGFRVVLAPITDDDPAP